MHNLQKHRLDAFSDTLLQVKAAAIRRRHFLSYYEDVYKFPKKLNRKNIAELNKLIKALETVEVFNLKSIK